MHFQRFLALGAILLGSACEVPVNTGASNQDFGVTSVAVQPKTVTVLVGDSMQLSASVIMSNNRPPNSVTWTSENTGLASVSASGVVHGRGVGPLFIRATSGSKRDSAAVTVVAPSPLPVAFVGVAPSSVTVTVGGTVSLVATLKDANGNPLTGRATTWASGSTGVVTVSAAGLVTAAGVGSATITATSEGQSGTAAVSVTTVPVASVTVSPTTASVLAGQTVQLTATPKDAGGTALSGRTVTWASSNVGVATVSASGLVSGVAAGSAAITATSEGQSATSTITGTTPTLGAPGTVTDLAVPAVTDSSATLSFTEVTDGAGQAASYDIRYVTGPTLTWGGSVPSVSRGTCTTPVAGTLIGAKRTCTVLGLTAGTIYSFQLVSYRGALTVNAVFGALSNAATATTAASTAPIAAVTVSPANGTLTVGNVLQLTAALQDAAGRALLGRAVAWSSSNTGVATVSGTGLVSGVAAGSATITATSEGVRGTAALTVTAVSSGGTVLLQENFADAAFSARGWYDTPDMPVTSAQHMPGATSALEIHMPPGAVYGQFGSAARHAFTPTPSLYVSYWVKYSDNWVGSGYSDHPHEFYVLSDMDGQYAALANDWLTAYIETNFINGAGAPRLALQDNLAINRNMGTVPLNLIGVTENRSVSGCNGVMETSLFSECYGSGTYNDKQFNRLGTVVFQAQPGAAGYKGNWNHVEVYEQMNSIVGGVAVPDGVLQYWFNGTLVIDRHDVMFRTGARPNLKFAQFIIGPYIGAGSPVDQYMWVDNLVLATSRP